MKIYLFHILIGIGILLLAYVWLYDRMLATQMLSVMVAGQMQTEANDEESEFVYFVYNVQVKNNHHAAIRLNGGRLDWCGNSGCYRVATPFPIILEPKQETTITVSISPGGDELSETEFILYADGKGLDGLTPVKIKLPAMSLKSP